ncbi:MAG TPA: hypothetical protein VMT52_02515 [Planctomycetota bacterium]|nr:hypothetical protein [Planctomycetota bacterium]
MVRFLHSSDWPLGRSCRFLADDARSRFPRARLRKANAPPGSSDEGRPEKMSCVLQLGAWETRVIVLSCSPERFRRPGEVRAVVLP